MEPWMWAVMLKPFATLLFFAALVIPLELGIRRVFPEGQLKNVLFDRTFRDRKPGFFMVWWFALVGGMWACIYIVYG